MNVCNIFYRNFQEKKDFCRSLHGCHKGKILNLASAQLGEYDQSNLLWLIFDSFPDLLHALKELGKNFGQISNQFLRICRPPYLNDAQKKRKLITARKRSLGQGNIFTPVCHSVHRGGVCMVALGGCMVLIRGGGHAWFYLGGMCGFIWGACMVLFGGGHAWFNQGCAWFYSGGMRGFIWGGMRGFFSFFGYNEIRSMSGRYASYWNAFLFHFILHSKNKDFIEEDVKFGEIE